MSQQTYTAWTYPTIINRACAVIWGYAPAPAIVKVYDAKKRIVISTELVHAKQRHAS